MSTAKARPTVGKCWPMGGCAGASTRWTRSTLLARRQAVRKKISVGEPQRDYVSAVKNVTEWGRCKKAGIARLQASGRADLQAAKLTVQDLMGHTKKRRTEDEAGPPPCSMTWCGCARSSCMLRPRAALMRRCRCWTAPGSSCCARRCPPTRPGFKRGRQDCLESK